MTDCRIISAELNDAELERKLAARIRMVRFEAKDVEAMTTTKPIEFFPAWDALIWVKAGPSLPA